MRAIGPGGIALRFLFSLILVFSTYNPSGYSWFHWFMSHYASITPLVALSGLLLLISWAIYIRATLRSLGVVGLLLASAFFGCFIWLLIDLNLVSLNNVSALTWLINSIIAAVLATGMSWSHLRRRMSGQVDADDVDEN